MARPLLATEFLSSSWDILKDALLYTANSTWEDWQIPRLWKQRLIKLYPKNKLCETLSDWRPISLMHVIYKLIARVLVNRIKLYLYKGIHRNQCGFIPRRQIVDNIAKAYVGIKYAKYTKHGVVTMQVDIEKTFDTTNGVLWKPKCKAWGLDLKCQG